jgi:prevent-host-death family protein
MVEVSVSELRQDIAVWLDRVRGGEEIAVTLRGVVVARVVPAADHRVEARRKLEALRLRARVGDVESPLDENWGALDARG